MTDTAPRTTRHSGLQTDLYQLTMAQGYWKLGRADEEAVFHLGFRKHPFAKRSGHDGSGGFALACGLEQAVEFVEALGFDEGQRAYLATLTGNDGLPLFDPGFLDWLGALTPTVDLDAMAEGTACFAHEPLLRVRGPLVQCQLLETGLLTILNFQTLIATKAARIVAAAEGDPVLEFGLRRAQGLDGGLSASRAAYVGGCLGTSNVAAAERFGIPVRGTHAHAWVMAFPSEVEAFEAYASALPNNCVFLVDTYDTLRGVDRAIAVGKQLRARGHEMGGIRLDSGDLAALSIGARERLDAAGFPDAKVVASNDLDEYRVAALKQAGARIDIWGVGTRLATAYDQPALGGVYKLSALRPDASQPWRRMVKLSSTPIKTSTPGILQVRRMRDASGQARLDLVYDVEFGSVELAADLAAEPVAARTIDPTSEAPLSLPRASEVEVEDLLQPVLRQGARAGAWADGAPALAQARERAFREIAALPERVRRHDAPDTYPVALEPRLAALKAELIASHGANE